VYFNDISQPNIIKTKPIYNSAGVKYSLPHFTCKKHKYTFTFYNKIPIRLQINKKKNPIKISLQAFPL